MKKEYIKSIVKMLMKCKDVALLDLIFRLLEKEENKSVGDVH